MLASAWRTSSVPAADIVVLSDDTGSVFALPSNGDGTFGALAPVGDVGGRARAVAVADFDEDGLLDAVVGDGDDDAVTPWFFRGLADGGFGAPVVLAETQDSNTYATGAAAGDFDADGHIDFVMGGDSANLSLYRGAGDGTFTQTTLTLRGDGRGIDVGDFDEDGHLDFVRATAPSGAVRLYLGDGAGGFTEAPVDIGDAGQDPYAVAAGDFDCDGHLDVVAVTGNSGSFNSFRGRGDGTFDAGVPHPELELARNAGGDAFDFDGDGVDDLIAVVAHRYIVYWRGLGDGSFGERTTLEDRPPESALGISAPPRPRRRNLEVSFQETIALGDEAAFSVAGSDADAGDAYDWDFGDGHAASGQSVAHTYASEGTFDVRMVHTDADGIPQCRRVIVAVQGDAPIANAGGPYTLGEDAAYRGSWDATLDGSGSTDDFGIASWEWDFGDGQTSTGTPIEHRWNGPGPWTVTLTVTDTSGLQASQQTTVTFVPGAPPDAVITGPDTVDETAARNGRWTTSFSAEGTDDDVGLWKYECFGNGRRATGFEETTFYDAAGVYTVTLTAYDHAVQTDVATHEVSIVASDPPVPVISGPTRLDESVATGGLWASSWDGMGSTDDTGVWTWDWDFGDGTTTRGAEVTHEFAGTGTYTVALTVTDNGRQEVSTTQEVEVVSNDFPTARFVIASPSVVEGEQPIVLDASGSTDDFGIYDYTWNLPPRRFGFGGAFIDPDEWTTGATVAQSDRLIIRPASRGWGVDFFFSRQTRVRRGATFEVRVDTPSGTVGRAAVGLRVADSTLGHYNNIVHGFMFITRSNGTGLVAACERGLTRGSNRPYVPGSSYDVRVVTKPDAGATYWVRPAGSGLDWELLHDSIAQENAEFGIGADVSQGVFGFDELWVDEVVDRGEVITTTTDRESEITLEVRDHALQAHAVTIGTVNTTSGVRPLALLAGPTEGEVGVDLTFDARASSDDHGVASYVWDFGDGTTFATRSGRTAHFWGRPGRFRVFVTVYDWAGQHSSASLMITITGEGLVKAVPWRLLGLSPATGRSRELPHETWSGREIVLKAVAGSAVPPVDYTWDFGDGSPPETGTANTLEEAYAIEARHVYSGPEDTPFDATITVTDADGNIGRDTYHVLIRPRSIEIEINIAIDDGLWFLHRTMERANIDETTRGGNWTFENHQACVTASAVQAFEVNGHREDGDGAEDPYVETVSRAMNFLMTELQHVHIDDEPWGDPDTNGNGIGLQADSAHKPYQLGQVMDAIIASGRPDLVAKAGPANVRGRPYGHLVQDMVDMYSWGQYEGDPRGGGWRYSWNSIPDNSAAQWGAIGLIAAERVWGLPAPQWVKDRNRVWLDFSSSDRGFGYLASGWSAGLNASGMVQLAWIGVPRSDALWMNAEDHIASEWDTSRITLGNNFYAFFAIAKAMRVQDPPIRTLAATGKDWFLDPTNGLARILVDRQDPDDGSWLSNAWIEERPYSTAWAVLMLSSSLFQEGPVAVVHSRPNPTAIGREITFDASASFHEAEGVFEIVEYRWDMDAADGIDFDAPDAVGPVVTHAYGELGTYEVTLQVADDNSPVLYDTASAVVEVTIPPHPPTAIAGGPYIAAVGERVVVDGSGSYDIDAADGDAIQSWDWETDFEQPLGFDDVTGETATIVGGFASSGDHQIGLRVTDRTEEVYPEALSPDLTDDDFAEVTVYNRVINDLTARPKHAKIQLQWTDRSTWDPDRNTGTMWHMQVLRSSAGPNHGFELIGATRNRWAVYIDRDVEVGVRYWYRLLVHDIDSPNAPIGVPMGSSSVAGATPLPRQRGTNLAPRIVTEAPLEVEATTEYRYDVDAIDAEGHVITYRLALAPTGMEIVAASGLVTYTPSEMQVGLHDALVEAVDSEGAIAAQFFEVLVTPRPNLPPVAEAGGPYSALRGEPIAFSSAGSSDPDGDPIEVTWSFGDGTTETGATPTHVYAAAGSYVATVIVSDGRGGTVSDEAVVEIGEPNRPPTAIVRGGPDFRVRLGQTIELDATASFDHDGDDLSFEWSWGDSTPADTDAMASHVYASEGVFSGALTVEDGHGGLDTYEFTVEVGAANTPPAPAFEITVLGRDPGDEFTFDGSASTDPEGDPFLLEWDFGDGSTTSGIVVTHVWDAPGDYTVALTARDDQGDEATTSQDVHINAPPTFDSTPPTAVNEDELFVYTIVVSDGDGENVTFELADAPSGMSFAADTGRLTWTPTATDVGDHAVRILATDAAGSQRGQAFIVTVTAINDAPVVVTSPPSSATSGRAYAYDVDATDEEDDALEFTLDAAPAGMTIGAATGLVEWLPDDGDVGLHDVTVRVTDLPGAFTTQSWSLEVRQANRPPEFTSAPMTATLEDKPYAYDADATDPDGDALVYSLAAAPDGMTIRAAIGLIEWTPTVADIGDHTIVVRADDGFDGQTMQGYTLSVVSVNDAPEITSPPRTEAEPGFAYVYRVTATDEESDSLEFALDAAPDGMTIDAASGLIQWTPEAADLGDHSVVVRVTDVPGASTTQAFTLTVADLPHAPEVLDIPDQVVQDGDSFEPIRLDDYVYDPDHLDSDLTWSVRGDSSNLDVTIGADRIATITYDPGVRTSRSVTFTATDPEGRSGSAVAAFGVVEPSSDDVPPVAVIEVAPDPLPLDTRATITVRASDDEGIDRVSASVDGVALRLSNRGGGVHESDWWGRTAGFHRIEAIVHDTSGNRFTASHDLLVADPNLASALEVEIAAPLADSVLTEPTPVVGTVTGEGLADYAVDFAPLGTNDYTVLAEGREPVTNATLATFDPTTLLDGFYTIRVTARTLAGEIRHTSIVVEGDPAIELAPFTVSFEDKTLLMGGFPLTVTRTYDSRDKRQGDFGYGWRLDFSGPTLTQNRMPGVDWEQRSSGGLFPVFTLLPTAPHKVLVQFDAFRKYEFRPVPSPVQSTLLPLQFLDRMDFRPEGELQDATLTASPLASFTNGVVGPAELYDEFFNVYVPQVYTFQTPDRHVYRFELDRGKTLTYSLAAVTNPEGITVRITPHGLLRSDGLSIVFERDDEDRISRIEDPAGGAIVYEYDVRGDLMAVTDEVGSRTTFVYEPGHLLTEIHDPRGNRAIRTEYDEDGRIVASTDASGRRIEFTHDIDGREELVRDRLGNVTRYIYDDRSNIVSAEKSVTVDGEPALVLRTFTYDDRSNKTSETDPEGRTATWEYDDGDRVVRHVDFEGRVKEWTYDAQGRVLTEIATNGNVTSNSLDDDGRLARRGVRDRDGARISEERYVYDEVGYLVEHHRDLDESTTAVTRYEYDDVGNRIATIDPLGHRIENEYDGNGMPTVQRMTRTRADGQFEDILTTFVYDAKQRLVERTDAAGTTSTTYNEIGKREASTDAGGNVTRYEYDDRGNLVRTVYPDGTAETTVYDAENRKIARTDQAGRTTHYVLDEIGRTVETILPDDTLDDLSDNSATRATYDRVGRMTSRIDAAGNVTLYEHVASTETEPRKQIVTDPVGGVTTHEYDEGDRETRRIDARGNEMRWEYDGFGRLVKTTYADGTFETVEYDLGGRKVAEVDAAGRRKDFEYDLAGRLVAVRGELDFVMTYAHDELGHLMSQMDGLGRTTRVEYDAAGRRIARTLSMGQRESYTYDDAGNRASKTDFNGATTTYEYDALNRLTRESRSDGTTVEYLYTATGLRSVVTDRRGDTTYEYDAWERLVRKTDADGSAIAYGYDTRGNRTSLTTRAGTTTYAFDDLGRPTSITDPAGAVTSYEYDAVGNRERVEYPDGTVTTHVYDALNRLTSLTTTNAGGAVIASYAYTLDPAGHRTRVVESGSATTGRTVDYAYDALWRLSTETIDEPGDDRDATISYEYDAVGNRLEREIAAAGGTTTTSYTYDDNDRLVREERSVVVARAAGGGGPVLCAFAPSEGAHRALLTFDGLVLAAIVAALLWLAIVLLRSRRARYHWRRAAWVASTQTAVWLATAVLVLGQRNLHAMEVNGRLWADQERALREAADAAEDDRDADVEAPIEADDDRHTRGIGGVQGTAGFLVYTHDANGNTLTRSDGNATDAFTYDAANRLIDANLEIESGGSDATAVAYEYDADGLRVSSTVGTRTTYSLVDTNRRFGQVVLETRVDHEVSYVWGDDLVSMTRPADEGGVRYYHYDGQLSVRHLTDESGAVVDEYTYDAFGALIRSTGATTNAYRYTGEQFDPNLGFYYLRARYYDAQSGRFLTADSWEGRTSDPATLHKYLYAHSDPVNSRDPSGNWTMTEMLIVVVIVAILSAILGTLVTGKLSTGLHIGFYAGASTAILFAAAAQGVLPLAVFMGVVQGVIQIALDQIDPNTDDADKSALLSFTKGFFVGASSVVAAAVGINAAYLAGALQLLQELVDIFTALFTGTTVDLQRSLTNVIVAFIAARASGALGELQITDAASQIVDVLVGVNAVVILNDLRGLLRVLAGEPEERRPPRD